MVKHPPQAEVINVNATISPTQKNQPLFLTFSKHVQVLNLFAAETTSSRNELVLVLLIAIKQITQEEDTEVQLMRKGFVDYLALHEFTNEDILHTIPNMLYSH